MKNLFFTEKENNFKVTVNKKPSQAGIDPMNLLVDLVGDDNLVRIDSEAEK